MNFSSIRLPERNPATKNRSFDISLTYALSGICEGSINIPVTYNQAIEVLDHKRILGIEEPMQYVENYDSQDKSKYMETARVRSVFLIPYLKSLVSLKMFPLTISSMLRLMLQPLSQKAQMKLSPRE